MAILGFLAGSIGAVIVLFVGYLLFTVITDYHDFEGATAMGIATVAMPLAALLGGIAGAIGLPILTRRRQA